ncbi:MAG: glycogen/starch synthase [Anaerolineae bacterium]|nr:glycogen/starch synthase [Anaerolineae bacterium]
MPKTNKKMRVAMPAWEIGRTGSGLGTKIGGLGVVVEELPPELVKAAAQQGLDLEVETLTPCFAHYDRSRLTPLDLRLPVTLDGHTFNFEVYQHVFPDGQKVVYFWDEWQLSWTNANAIYPSDPQMAIKLFAAVGQAMAGYIKQGNFHTIHLHDYHVGLIPFYLGDDFLRDVPVHLTIHNATYQGITPLIGGGYRSLDRLNLPGEKLFHKYFDFFDNLNVMKACMLKVHETGGKITTVSGDIAGTWGYAAELKENHAAVWARAYAQKGSPPGEVFVPNRHLDLFEKLPIAGITNGLSDINRPENLPELKAETLSQIQARRGPYNPIFKNPTVQTEMLARDHTFDANNLAMKAELKRLLHLETFGAEPIWDPILITAVGRLVEQKNLGLVADIIERTLAYDGGTKFIILASAPEGDAGGKATEANFFRLAALYPQRVYFNNTFNQPLSKLILAGGDFTLIPSRFEPCGLVDYEASLVGNVVIGRAIGGLVKVRHCAYLYDWLDISDRPGEANAFFWQIKAAIDNYRSNHAHHDYLVRTAMAINSSWDASAAQYVEMYRYGLLIKKWQKSRRQLIDKFLSQLNTEKELFAEFFIPGRQEYADRLDWELKEALS